MSCLLLSHPECERHEMARGHPEQPARLAAIQRQLATRQWGDTLREEIAPSISREQLSTAHPQSHVDYIYRLAPGEGLANIDGDTAMNRHSLAAALHAAGSGIRAIDAVIGGEARQAFCAVRPPGHHAESTIAMGFCLFNSIALAAEQALARGAARVAILDFDVHHGNGTVEIFRQRPEVMVCSSFQHPFYPGRHDRCSEPHIVLNPLAAGTGSSAFRQALETTWEPALYAHQPDLILVSAGFDGHAEDPLGGLQLQDADYLWLGQWINKLAGEYCGGRSISMLEGGYHLDALGRSVEQYLLGLTSA